MHKLIIILIALWSVSCKQNKEQKEQNKPTTHLKDSLDNRVSQQNNVTIKDTIIIKSLQSALERSEQRFRYGNGVDSNLDTIIDESQQIINYIEKYKDEAFQLKDNNDFFYMTISEDKKLSIIRSRQL